MAVLGDGVAEGGGQDAVGCVLGFGAGVLAALLAIAAVYAYRFQWR